VIITKKKWKSKHFFSLFCVFFARSSSVLTTIRKAQFIVVFSLPEHKIMFFRNVSRETSSEIRKRSVVPLPPINVSRETITGRDDRRPEKCFT
jgi:hypothetical protein